MKIVAQGADKEEKSAAWARSGVDDRQQCRDTPDFGRERPMLEPVPEKIECLMSESSAHSASAMGR
jgi:hypothetical protein